MSVVEKRYWTEGIAEGRKLERELIIQLLEDEQRKCEQAGLFANDPSLRSDLQTLFIGLSGALDLIKGE